jgi:DNA-binding PadR family transcriptional regulator
MRKNAGHPDRELLHGNAETLVLAVLAGKECHGYQIRKELARCSHDYFQFTFGSLYPLLRRLEGRGLVKARWIRVGRVRERKNYQITPQGRAALRDYERRWHQFCEAMELVMRARRR